jgi:hypothetical protein
MRLHSAYSLTLTWLGVARWFWVNFANWFTLTLANDVVNGEKFILESYKINWKSIDCGLIRKRNRQNSREIIFFSGNQSNDTHRHTCWASTRKRSGQGLKQFSLSYLKVILIVIHSSSVIFRFLNHLWPEFMKPFLLLIDSSFFSFLARFRERTLTLFMIFFMMSSTRNEIHFHLYVLFTRLIHNLNTDLILRRDKWQSLIAR